MGVIPEGKTEGQGRKGKTKGLSATKTGLKHSENRQGAGQSFGTTGFSATAQKMGRGKVSRK